MKHREHNLQDSTSEVAPMAKDVAMRIAQKNHCAQCAVQCVRRKIASHVNVAVYFYFFFFFTVSGVKQISFVVIPKLLLFLFKNVL
jgi:hypothetical protein